MGLIRASSRELRIIHAPEPVRDRAPSREARPATATLIHCGRFGLDSVRCSSGAQQLGVGFGTLLRGPFGKTQDRILDRFGELEAAGLDRAQIGGALLLTHRFARAAVAVEVHELESVVADLLRPDVSREMLTLFFNRVGDEDLEKAIVRYNVIDPGATRALMVALGEAFHMACRSRVPLTLDRGRFVERLLAQVPGSYGDFGVEAFVEAGRLSAELRDEIADRSRDVDSHSP